MTGSAFAAAAGRSGMPSTTVEEAPLQPFATAGGAAAKAVSVLFPDPDGATPPTTSVTPSAATPGVLVPATLPETSVTFDATTTMATSVLVLASPVATSDCISQQMKMRLGVCLGACLGALKVKLQDFLKEIKLQDFLKEIKLQEGIDGTNVTEEADQQHVKGNFVLELKVKYVHGEGSMNKKVESTQEPSPAHNDMSDGAPEANGETRPSPTSIPQSET
ncbi:unnamed protein product [Urochloa humidicola]